MCPLIAHFKLSVQQCPKTETKKQEVSNVPYSSVVGCLMYAMIGTRPYLAHAIGMVSRFMENLKS